MPLWLSFSFHARDSVVGLVSPYLRFPCCCFLRWTSAGSDSGHPCRPSRLTVRESRAKNGTNSLIPWKGLNIDGRMEGRFSVFASLQLRHNWSIVHLLLPLPFCLRSPPPWATPCPTRRPSWTPRPRRTTRSRKKMDWSEGWSTQNNWLQNQQQTYSTRDGSEPTLKTRAMNGWAK